MEMNKEIADFIQVYIVQPQLVGSDETRSEDAKMKSEGLKRVIQKSFIKHQIIGFDSIKPLIETDSDMEKLYLAISDKESKETASDIFNEAIEEVKSFIAVEFGLAPRRKRAHEILAEELEEKYGEGHIENNINRLIKKNTGTSGDSGECNDGSCGC